LIRILKAAALRISDLKLLVAQSVRPVERLGCRALALSRSLHMCRRFPSGEKVHEQLGILLEACTCAEDCHQTAPRASQEDPKGPQKAAKTAHKQLPLGDLIFDVFLCFWGLQVVVAKGPQEHPKMHPRATQDGPRPPQEAPKRDPKAPKMAQDHPKRAQDLPKSRQKPSTLPIQYTHEHLQIDSHMYIIYTV